MAANIMRGYLRMLKLVTGECVIAVKAGDGGYGEPITVVMHKAEGEEHPVVLLSMTFIPYGLVDYAALPQIEIPESAVILAVPVTDSAADAYFDAKERINNMVRIQNEALATADESVESGEFTIEPVEQTQ